MAREATVESYGSPPGTLHPTPDRSPSTRSRNHSQAAAASKAMGALNNRAIPQLSGGWVGNGSVACLKCCGSAGLGRMF